MDRAVKILVAYCLSVWATRYILILVQTSSGVRRLISECDRCELGVSKRWFNRFRRKKGKSEPGCESCSAYVEERRQIAATRVVPESHTSRSGSRTEGGSEGVRGIGDENIGYLLVRSDTGGTRNEAGSEGCDRGDAEARRVGGNGDGSGPMSSLRLGHALRQMWVESMEEDSILAAHRALGRLDPDALKVAVGLNSVLFTVMAIWLYLHRKGFDSRRPQPQRARHQQEIPSTMRRRTRVSPSVSERSRQRWEDWDTPSLREFMTEEARTMANPERVGQVTTIRDKGRLVCLAQEWKIPFLTKAEFRKQQAAASRLEWVIDSSSGRLVPRRGHPHQPMTPLVPQPTATSASLAEQTRRAQSDDSLTPRVAATPGTMATGPRAADGDSVDGGGSEGGGAGGGRMVGRGGGRGGGLSAHGEDRRSFHRAFVSGWVSREGVVMYEVEVEVLGVGEVVRRVYRRYTDFLNLWKAVSSKYPTMRNFVFPPKEVFFSSTSVFPAAFGGETVEDQRRKIFSDLLARLVNLDPRPPELLLFLRPRMVEGATRIRGTSGDLDPSIGNPRSGEGQSNSRRRRRGERLPPQHATEGSMKYEQTVPTPRNLHLATFLACVSVAQFYMALHILEAASMTVLFLLMVDTSQVVTIFLCVREILQLRQSNSTGHVEEPHDERMVDRRPPTSGGRHSSGIDVEAGGARHVRELSPLERDMPNSEGGICHRLQGAGSTQGARRIIEAQDVDGCSGLSDREMRGVSAAAGGTSQVGIPSIGSELSSRSEPAGRGDAGIRISWEKIAMAGEIGVAGVLALAVVVRESDCSFLGHVAMALKILIAVIGPPLYAAVTTARAGRAARGGSEACGMPTDFVQASPVDGCVHSTGGSPAVQQSGVDVQSGDEELRRDAE